MDIYSIYEDVLSGKLKKFPNHFWKLEDGKKRGCILFKYLIEEKLRLSKDDIKEQINVKFFVKHKLGGMIAVCYKQSPYAVINDTYPNLFMPWEFLSTPNEYWTYETAVAATKWLVEEKLMLNRDDIVKIQNSDFVKNGLASVLFVLYQSVAKTIMEVYPNEFKEWEFNSVSTNFWNNVTRKEALHWLFYEKLQLSEIQVIENISLQLFKEYKLEGLLYKHFNSSPFEVVNFLYPNKYKPWELKKCPHKYWTKVTAREAAKWLYEEKFGYLQTEVLKKVTVKTFIDHGLSSVIHTVYNGSLREAYIDVYLNESINS